MLDESAQQEAGTVPTQPQESEQRFNCPWKRLKNTRLYTSHSHIKASPIQQPFYQTSERFLGFLMAQQRKQCEERQCEMSLCPECLLSAGGAIFRGPGTVVGPSWWNMSPGEGFLKVVAWLWVPGHTLLPDLLPATTHFCHRGQSCSFSPPC